MKILVHDYAGHPFPTSLSRELARRGHDVLHAFFGGDKGPKGALRLCEGDGENLRFEPLSIFQKYDKGSFVRRRFADISYGKNVARLIEHEKPNLVISGNTPTEAQSFIVTACKTNKATFIYWVQDFYSVAVSSILKRKLGLIGAAVGMYYRSLERRQMRSSDGIVTITRAFEDLSIRWGGQKDKVTTIENWGLLDDIVPSKKDNPWSRKHGLAGSFNFLYSGTLGFKHNPMFLVELARRMKGRAQVVVVSGGVGVSVLERCKESDQLENLILLPLAPFEELTNVLGAADVAVAAIESEAGAFSVPSKVWSYLCAGRPVLLAAPPDNLASMVIKRERAGAVVDQDDLPGFLAAAERMLADPSARAEFGRNGRTYADLTFDIAAVTDRFLDVFSRAHQRRAACY
jgi:glycosyltransferase involved in cell wall biosynthesis